MGQVNYVSSAGWGVFVGEIKGIRENGGDLKIVQMLPEVNEIFEMLEFNRILAAYDNIEEAIDDFDLSIGLDITKSVARTLQQAEANGRPVTETLTAPPPPRKPDTANKSRSAFKRPKLDPSRIPVTEQIKLIITEDPILGAWKIRKELNTERFGYRKVSGFHVIKVLRKLSLDSKEKRVRFYRSR